MIRSDSGFTFIELVIAVSIIALTLAFAGPSMEEFSKISRTKGAAREIYNLLQQARLTAIDTNNDVVVTITPDGVNGSEGGRVQSPAGTAVFEPGGRNEYRGVYIGGSAEFTTTLKAAGTADPCTIRVKHDDPDIEYDVVVNGGGAVRLQKKDS